MPSRCRKLSLVGVLLVFVGAGVSTASAQQPLQLMDLPGNYTDVIDAFDGDDLLDLNVRVGFIRSSRSGTIQRETVAPTTDGFSTRRLVDVAEHTRITNTLRLGLDVGIYKDLAVYGVVPVVLRDSRELSPPAGRPAQDVAADLNEPVRDAAGNPTPADQDPQLFQLPFAAPARSGIPAIHLGIAWAASNQHRTADVPTWVLMVETRIATGDVLKACSVDPGCSDPGVGDGTSAIRFESRTSYRYRYIEPYVGFALELPWVSTGEALFGSNLDGLVNRQPPRTGEITVGGSIVPWEDRERHQRVAIDVRLSGAYVSEGRGITPLFDALGTSANGFLRAPNYDRLVPIAENPTAVSMTGVTDTTAHARVGFQTAAVIQAAKYIRFVLGLGFGYATPYLVTGTDACNPSIQARAGDPRRGGCGDAGILNPAHRPVIDVAGKRFRLDGEFGFDLYSSATAQF